MLASINGQKQWNIFWTILIEGLHEHRLIKFIIRYYTVIVLVTVHLL